MRYLVMSDSHGDSDIVVEIAKMYENKVDAMFHCGDSELEPSDKVWEDFYVVGGNCDYSSDYEDVQVVTLGSDTIFLTHGHLYGVNFGMERLSLAAKEANATIALFGHTHRAGCEVIDRILYLNPGSISQPRGLIQKKLYAIIDSDETRYDIQYYSREHVPQKELHFVFKK
ncbi:MAG: metallophosphoesterase [Lactobacillales bacterium]|jgi:putative phosphoesterase|nr:metallophosphoesterase [Lactobacillales bacterium]